MVISEEKEIATVVKALISNRFDTVFVETAEEAKKIVLEMIPSEATFVMAGSTTVSQLGLMELVMGGREKGASSTDRSLLSHEEIMRRDGDVLLTSSSAVTMDGKLVNIDGAGNRVSRMIFGPKKVILVVGMNKIVRDVDEALNRIKNVIAPYHAKFIGRNTPCARTGVCSDCNSPERICNITTILEKKPSMTDMSIILVGEDMGLGWNPDWDVARKDRIASAYRNELEKMMQARKEG